MEDENTRLKRGLKELQKQLDQCKQETEQKGALIKRLTQVRKDTDA